MNITKTNSEGKTILVLEGRLDTITAPQLQDILVPAVRGEKVVVLDFAQLDYVSSAGLRVLLMGQKTSVASSSEMIVKNVSESVMEVFEMTGFSDILTIEK